MLTYALVPYLGEGLACEVGEIWFQGSRAENRRMIPSL